MHRPLAIALPLAFWLGTPLGGLPGAPWIAGATALALLVTAGGSGGAGPLLLAALAGGTLAGAAEHRWNTALPSTPPTMPARATVEAVTLRGPAIDVRLALDGQPHHRAQLRLVHRPPGVAPGARVRVTGRLRDLAPADESGGWDARSRGAAERIGWRGPGAVDVIEPASVFAEWPIRVRERARRRLEARARPYGAALLTGLLLGDRAAVPEGARDALQATGTGHLLAVSGLHVGGLAVFVGGLGLVFARRVSAVNPAAWGALVAAPAVLGFVALAQFPLSACRAGLMVGLYLAGRALGRRPDPVILLGWAAVILLADHPSAASSAGFQLSFGAVGALLWLGPSRGLRGAALTAVVAAAATAPIEAWHFGTVAPIAPLANLILCPLVALGLVPLGLLGLLLAPICDLPLEVAAAGAEVLAALAEAMAAHGGSVIVGRWMAPAVAVPLALVLALRTRRPGLGGLATVGLLAAAALGRPAGTTVDFLPVGQGDAVLVRSAGHAMLVDAGPDPRGFHLLGALRRAGVGRLDAVYVTHGHPDHFAGLEALLGRIEIGAVRFNGRPAGRLWQGLARRITRRDIPLEVPRPGRFSLGTARVELLTAGGPPRWSENDASLTLRVADRAASVLLTGDVEAAGEARLLAGRLDPTTVLKAPHHGSRTSSQPALIERLCPAAVVYTVGRHNRHRLPNPTVLARYAAAGIDGYRTDVDGRVTVRLDVARITAHRRPMRQLAPAGCGLDRLLGPHTAPLRATLRPTPLPGRSP